MSEKPKTTIVILERRWSYARKQLTCSFCNAPISLGSKYHRADILRNGEHEVFRSHYTDDSCKRGRKS